MEKEIVFKELSYVITGLLFKTHRELGICRNEKQYGDFFENLLKNENIIYLRELPVDSVNEIRPRCIVDFLIDNKIVLEFKAKNFLTKEDFIQTKRYLVTMNLQLGILVNFRQTRLSPKRVLNLLNY